MWKQVQQALDQSMIRVLNELASLIPGLAALIVAMLCATLVAWAIAFVLRRILQGLQFDERLPDWGFESLADWSPAKSPTQLIVRAAFWIVIVIGFLIGIAAFDATLTSQFMFACLAICRASSPPVCCYWPATSSPGFFRVACSSARSI